MSERAMIRDKEEKHIERALQAVYQIVFSFILALNLGMLLDRVNRKQKIYDCTLKSNFLLLLQKMIPSSPLSFTGHFFYP